MIATTIVGGLVVYVLWAHVPRLWLAAWLLALAATTLARVWLRRAYFRAKPPVSEVGPWVRRFLIGVLVSGVIWGIAGVFPISPNDVVAQMFLVFVLAGLAAGGMSTLSSFRGAYAAFLVPAILPFAIKIMLQEGEVSVAMSSMLMLFIGMMSLISARHYKSVTESLLLRFDNAELLDDLAAARDRQQAINRELEGQMRERLRTEDALRRAHDDLESKVQERTAQLAQTNAVLSHQATHDTLTGLVNRNEFERRLIHLLGSASPHIPHALLYLDLDQFKVVNDTCGHAAGDELLRQISALLRTKLRARDTLARLGGDEFGVLLEHCSLIEAGRIAHSLLELLQGFRFGWNDRSFTIGVSIGLVPITQAGETLAGVFSAADSSCYAAKDKGRNRVHVYQPGDTVLAERDGEMRWMPRIQQALADERFRLYYQPIIPLSSIALEGAQGEILIRMLDEAGRIVLPEIFLPAAARYDLMLPLDRWVVRTSLQALSATLASGGDVTFAINISGQSLGATDFLEFVTEQITATRVAPHKLCFEITETSAISELAHALRFIDTLKALGCQFALDDFGTGLSSFSYLKALPVDYLKIDGGFVRGLAEDNIDHAMVEAVHHIGHIMGIKTVAEWVETREILHKLRQIGVDYGQGYALGHPRPLDQPQARSD